MRILATLAAFGCLACNGRRSDSVADASPDAAPFCGDGLVNQPTEQCDDGAVNGTLASFCTKQCLLGSAHHPGPITSILMPRPYAVKQIVDLYINDRYAALAFTSSDDPGAHVMVGLAGGGFSTTSQAQVTTLMVHSDALGIGRLWKQPTSVGGTGDFSSPLWVERPVAGVGGPWLFFATFASDLTPTIHEIPYPFADGAGGMILSEDGQMPVLIDHSVQTNELQVAVIVARTDSDIHVYSQRLPGRGSRLGAFAGDPGWAVDLVAGGQANRIVQFYDDTLAFETVEIRPPVADDWFALNGDYSIQEYGHGTWPTHVAQAAFWTEGYSHFQNNAGPDPRFTHPYPTAVISDAGDILIWQFVTSPGENDLAPYAHVLPGSLMAFPEDGLSGAPEALWVLQPDGTQVVLVDSDDSDCRSPALQPIEAPGISSWTAGVAALPLQENDIDLYRPYFAADSTLYWFNSW